MPAPASKMCENRFLSIFLGCSPVVLTQRQHEIMCVNTAVGNLSKQLLDQVFRTASSHECHCYSLVKCIFDSVLCVLVSSLDQGGCIDSAVTMVVPQPCMASRTGRLHKYANQSLRKKAGTAAIPMQRSTAIILS